MAISSAMSCFVSLALVSALLLANACSARVVDPWEPAIRMPTERAEPGGGGEEDEIGTRWAVLVAGSSGYGNYRHQADVCHAYQLLKGGVKEENIVVFMYDDIANNPLNPRPGVLINHPQGQNVYAGVPKDYTGEQVTSKNLYAVLLGNKTAVEGGSGKVVDSKPNDRIFIFYSDHGGPGVLGMPNMPFLYAIDFIEVLKKKHASGSYKEMVIYVEACESGSMFEGLMPGDLNIYVTTASNAEESSWGTYCPGMDPPPPPEYMTCLGDLYSVAWMEDSETHNLKTETIKKQYEVVKERTSNYNTYNVGSHVMEYGTKSFKDDELYLYQGFDPANANFSDNALHHGMRTGTINQRDADLLFLWQRVYSNRAACYTKLGALPEGLKDAEKCIELDPSFSKGCTRKGAVQYLMKEYDNALKTYQEGLKHDPNNQELIDGIRRCVEQINKTNRGDISPEELKERQAKAFQDPEIQNILSDPIMHQVLDDLQENPRAAQGHLKNPQVMHKIQKLISAGIVQMR